MAKGNNQKTANGSALDFEAQLWAAADIHHLRPVQTAALLFAAREQPIYACLFALRCVPFRNLNRAETGQA